MDRQLEVDPLLDEVVECQHCTDLCAPIACVYCRTQYGDEVLCKLCADELGARVLEEYITAEHWL